MGFRFFLIALIFFLTASFSSVSIAQQEPKSKNKPDTISFDIEYLKSFLDTSGSGWSSHYSGLSQKLNSLINYLEEENPDSVVTWFENNLSKDSVFFYRSSIDLPDNILIPGFVTDQELEEMMKDLDYSVKESIVKQQIPVPEQLLSNLSLKVNTVPPEESTRLLEEGKITLPDSLRNIDASPDSLSDDPDQLKVTQYKDSIRQAFIEKSRIEYNDRLISQYIDSVAKEYRDEYVDSFSKKLQNELTDSIRLQNMELLTSYNDSVVRLTNDSVYQAINRLISFVREEPSNIQIYNSDMKSTILSTNNVNQLYTRLFIKNAQNDSLNIKIENAGRNSLQISIDDAVTLSRFRTQDSRTISLQDNRIIDNSLKKSENRFTITTPWKLGIDGNVGFTQTYLNNWKRGGKSSLSALLIFKGFANYSLNKLKWENSLEIRNGWINPADDKIQKNDDKFEVISRVGLSAFKKWYYSTEIDFLTQFFNGYNYPDREKRISGFLSPAKTLIKLGLDYKPNNDVSMFLSPITAKNVFVRDTVHIDAGHYGIDEGKRSFWNLGMNAEIKYKRLLVSDITYETNYKMFVNYRAPFSAIDVDWENNLTMQLNSYINLRLLLHLVYDDNVTFPTDKIDLEGNTIYKPKWQLKEFMTIGFSYKLNKQIRRRERKN